MGKELLSIDMHSRIHLNSRETVPLILAVNYPRVFPIKICCALFSPGKLPRDIQFLRKWTRSREHSLKDTAISRAVGTQVL